MFSFFYRCLLDFSFPAIFKHLLSLFAKENIDKHTRKEGMARIQIVGGNWSSPPNHPTQSRFPPAAHREKQQQQQRGKYAPCSQAKIVVGGRGRLRSRLRLRQRRCLNARLVLSVIFVLEAAAAAAEEIVVAGDGWKDDGWLGRSKDSFCVFVVAGLPSSSSSSSSSPSSRPRRLFRLKCVIDVKSGNKLFFICACFQFV